MDDLPPFPVEESSTPRRLTEKEIRWICRAVPHPNPGKSYLNILRREQQENLAIALRADKRCWSSSKIRAARREIHAGYMDARIGVASTVGASAVSSTGERTTQDTLSSFHFAGSKSSANISSGLDAFKAVAGATDKTDKKDFSSDIHLLESPGNYNHQDIFEARKKFQSLTMRDIILSYSNMAVRRDTFKWWHRFYASLNNLEFPPRHSRVLRVFLDPKKLFELKLYPSDIAAIIQKREPKGIIVYPSPLPETILDIMAPIEVLQKVKGMPEIDDDIMIRREKERGVRFGPEEEETISEEFEETEISMETVGLDHLVNSFLPNIRVHGIEGISEVFTYESIPWSAGVNHSGPYLLDRKTYLLPFPEGWKEEEILALRNRLQGNEKIPSLEVIQQGNNFLLSLLPYEKLGGGLVTWEVLQELLSEVNPELRLVLSKVPQEQPGEVWKLTLSHYNISLGKIGDKEILAFLTHIGCQPLWVERTQYIYLYVLAAINPTDLQSAGEERLQKKIANFREAHSGSPFAQPPEDEYEKYKYYHSLQTQGTNLMALLNTQGVDSTRTVSNSIHEINHVLGIGATEKFLLKRIVDIVSQGGDTDLDLRHVYLIVKFMTLRGVIDPITDSGISSQASGTLVQISFEQVMRHIQEGSMGHMGPASAVSTSLILGKPLQIGEAAVEQAKKKRKQKEIRRKIAERRGIKIEDDMLDSPWIEDDEAYSHERPDEIDEEEQMMQDFYGNSPYNSLPSRSKNNPGMDPNPTDDLSNPLHVDGDPDAGEMMDLRFEPVDDPAGVGFMGNSKSQIYDSLEKPGGPENEVKRKSRDPAPVILPGRAGNFFSGRKWS